MKDYYIRFGRRFVIPSTVQIKHEIMRVVLDNPVLPALQTSPQPPRARLV